MINLFENYAAQEIDLEYSLQRSHQGHLTIVLQDNGFLPVHVVSPIGFFTRMDMYKKTSKDKPRFFNELSLPAYWEIRGTGNGAEIYEGYKKKGNIFYSQRKGDYRLIQSVEWLNDSGRVRAVDLYNQNGRRFGRESYSDGEHALTSYFDLTGREVIIINHILNTIQVYFNQKSYIFSDYIAFVLFFLEAAQVPVENILYNHLGQPYFVTQALQEKYPEKMFDHILFWQEESGEMPGNMRGMFEAPKSSTTQIVVQNHDEYERLKKQVVLPSPIKVSYLGYLYHFKKEAEMGHDILIHTNSDQLEAIENLIQELPDFHFHISARTEMSEKLMRLEEFSNVSLYPNITSTELETLLLNSHFYLDINHGGELDNIVRQAFEHNLLLFSFAQTIHNSRMINSPSIYEKTDVKKLVENIKESSTTTGAYLNAIQAQRRLAGQANIKDYEEVLK
ncbi:accessory Sec system glycosylation chaperone GtfB [Lactococcus petauri]|uniref:accessory Sec system glycosylation chaperone GtfB n=1 Tax=Lactococcus petauri TaxID=1940789 RepID=UPI0018ABDB17|nr:accessory Sec system glycosylation chaperone GtfB [Lactococcus petauri]MDC0827033.1 accessory Sec system glycosylation chaperone GtfB [Lactococcus petauri]